MQACVDGAYDEKFEAEDIVPVTSAGGGLFSELYHGKTAAFKDMALSILPYLLTTAMKKRKRRQKNRHSDRHLRRYRKSGSEGFADVEGTEIIVFFPSDGVSEVQKRQMTTQEGKIRMSSRSTVILTTPRPSKKIFNDDEFSAMLKENGIKLSSANSINIGRLVPQVAYYVYATSDSWNRVLSKKVKRSTSSSLPVISAISSPLITQKIWGFL